MIIECPACQTRYDIKTVLPAEGRTVRCAKCQNLWRAMPAVEEAEESAAAEAPRQADESSAHEAAASQSFAGFSQAAMPDRGEFHAADGNRTFASDRADRQELGEDYPPQFNSEAEAQTAEEPREEKVSWFGNFKRNSDQRNKQRESGDAAQLPFNSGGTGETIPFPKQYMPDDGFVAEGESIGTLEEAREAVRSVFSSLTETKPAVQNRPYVTPVLPSQFPQQEEPPAAADDSQSAALKTALRATLDVISARDGRRSASSPSSDDGAENGRDAAADEGSSEIDRAKGEAASRVARALEQWEATHPPSHEPEAEQSENEYAEDRTGEIAAWNSVESASVDAEQDGPAATDWQTLRHFPSAHRHEEDRQELANSPDETGSEIHDALTSHGAVRPEVEQAEAAAFGEQQLAQELETQLRFNTTGALNEKPATWTERNAAALWKRPTLSLDELAGNAEQEAEITGGESAFLEEKDFDNNLYRQIEETQEHAATPVRGRGGLALAAGWGLFLCTALGVIMGFFLFRDMAAAALPGLAPVYRKLGMPVTVQALVFENVQYQWEVSGAKPALLVTGSVFNQAHRKVKIPAFFITIKDKDPQLDREYSASFDTTSTKIKGGQRVDFEVELVDPNSTITAIELNLRSVK